MSVSSTLPKPVRSLASHWPIAVVVLLTAWIYLPVRDFEFVDYGDPSTVSANPEVAAGLSGGGIAWAFTTFHGASWQPLTWVAHMLDVELFGLDAGSHHLVSLALHLVNVLLLYAVLRRLRLGVALAAGLASVFALHPLRVESVAWIVARKDVLSGTFFLLCLWFHASAVRHGGRRLWVVLCLALGLLTSPMLVSVPLVLLMLDVWPLERREPLRARLKEKLPLFLLAAASAGVTLWAHASGGAVQSFERLPLEVRVAHAPVAFFGYLRRLFWPTDLACSYPHPALFGEGLRAVWSAGTILAMLGVLALGAAARWHPRRKPWFTSGVGWTFVMLAPVIGIVQVDGEALSDRYAYLSLVGISVLVFIKLRQHLGERGLLMFFVPLFLAMGWSTHRTLVAWRDTTTLYRHALEVAPDNYVVATELGTLLAEAGSYEEARVHLERAAELAPRDPRPPTGLGTLHLLRREVPAARAAFEAALAIAPDFAPAQRGLGAALAASERP